MGKKRRCNKNTAHTDVESEAARNYAEWLGQVDRCGLVADKLDLVGFLLGETGTLDSPSDTVVNGLVMLVLEGAEAIRELCDTVMNDHRTAPAPAGQDPCAMR